MNLNRNEINIKVIDINSCFYLLVTDLTISIVQIDTNAINSLDTDTFIAYKDICNVILDNSSKVLTNDIKLKALLLFINKNKDLFTDNLMKSLNSLVTLDLSKFSKKELKIIKVLSEKLNKTEKRYQDRRRIERMLKEFKYYLIEKHNSNVKEVARTVSIKPLNSLESYLEQLIPINKINTVPVPIPNRGVCHVKEKNLYKSKYTKDMEGSDLIHLLYKCLNTYRKSPLNYSKILSTVYKTSSNIKVKSNKSLQN